MLRWLIVASLLCPSTASNGSQPGVVVLSTGETMAGKIGFRTLKLRLLRQGKPAVQIPWNAITAVQMLPWRERDSRQRLRGSGKTSKPTIAPLLTFRARVVLHNGTCLWGQLSTTFTIEQQQGGPRTFGLSREQQGKLGQRLEELQYVAELRFAKLPATVPCDVTLQLAGIQDVESVRVFGINSQHMRRARKNTQADSYRVDGLWPDRYDLLVVSKTAVYISLNGEIPTTPDDVLTSEKQRSLGRFLARNAGEDVKRRALKITGRVRRSRVLLMEETRKQGKLTERRLDIYQVEFTGSQWQVTHITPLFTDQADARGDVRLRWINIHNPLGLELTERQSSRAVTLDAKTLEKR